jgi:arginine deiminase
VDLKAQHRVFSNLLRSRGATVVHVKDLLTEITQQGEDAKRELFEMAWGRDFVEKYGLRNLNVEHLVSGYGRRLLDFDFPPLMNLFFMRDPAFSVPGGWVVISRPFFPIRQQESKLVKAIFKLHPGLKGIKTYDGLADDPDVFIEGGDVLVADDETVLVGISQRTNERGADRLAEFLFEKTSVTRVVKVFIPKQRAFMHLDTLFTFVDKGVVLTMPYFWSRPEVYAEVARRTNELNEKMGSSQRTSAEDWIKEPPRIEMLIKGEAKPKKYQNAMSGLQAEGIVQKALFVCGPEGSWPSEEEHVARALTEQWNDAANVFCISPGTVVAYKWCTRTVSHLQDAGIDVIELDGVELMKGRGGARCMTMPLRRSAPN